MLRTKSSQNKPSTDAWKKQTHGGTKWLSQLTQISELFKLTMH